MSALAAERIFKRYGSTATLQGVSLSVPRGSVVAVVGPSGAGKTTLLKALALVAPPESGTICIDNLRYEFPRAPAKRARWPGITMVFQQLFLWPHLSLRENIELPVKATAVGDWELYRDELVASLSLDGLLDRYPNEVSHGQRQRAAIARGLLVRPRYVLLDEVTSALDLVQVERLALLVRQTKEQGTGILIATHSLGFAREVADRICVIEAGRLVFSGTVDDFSSLADPQLRRLLGIL